MDDDGDRIEGGDVDHLSSSSSSSSGSSLGSLAPKMQEQFANLSAVLLETNENLHTFEFMLGQCRQQAKIRPLLRGETSADEKEQATPSSTAAATGEESSDRLKNLLEELNTAVAKVGALKDQLGTGLDMQGLQAVLNETLKGAEVAELKERLQKTEMERQMARSEASEAKLEAATLRERNVFLESELRAKTSLSDQLKESVHRSRAALAEEREKNLSLDQRLEKEKRAAHKIGQDITSYVERMKSLEEEVVMLRATNAKRTSSSKTVNMKDDTLSVTEFAATTGTNEETLVKSLSSESRKRKSVEAKAARYEEQIRDYEGQMSGLKRGLEALQEELETVSQKQSAPHAAAAAAVGGSVARVEEVERDLRRLKSKSKVLLRQYRQKKDDLSAQARKMAVVRQALMDVRSVCATTEHNYKEIMNHLGSEIEISSRLMAAYLDVDVAKHQPVTQLYGRPMAEWFCDIQALSTWLQRQIVAFGKRVWTDREPAQVREKNLPFPVLPMMASASAVDTASEVSQSIGDDDEAAAADESRLLTKNHSIREVIRSHDRMVRSRNTTIDKMLSDIP